jgi:methylthioribulose 1-phosphate dehydratase/enolase-phosphatase E1
VYVWGRDWIQAKTQAECYDYLFEAAVKMAQLGINAALPPAPQQLPAANGIRDGKRPAEEDSPAGAAQGGWSRGKEQQGWQLPAQQRLLRLPG